MTGSDEGRERGEPRREFLRRLARASVFVPPAVLSLDVPPASGQKGKGQAVGQQTVGGLTPAEQTAPADAPTLQEAPWGERTPGTAPPWAEPPGGGGEEEE